ncbi:MAG: mucoidy inhibitor MuiA family protein [Steroidobacteraceae bacterium]
MRCIHALLFLGWVSGAAMAADIPAALRIDQVTVYIQGAMITRSGSVNLPAGSHRLIVRGLPAGIDSRLLRVNVGSASVRLGSVDVSTVNEGQFVTARERELRTQLETKTDQRAAVQDEIDTAQTQLKLLDSLASNPAGNANGAAAVNGANLTTVLGAMGSSAAAARSKVRDARLRQRALDRDIETLKAELAKVATQRKQTTEVSTAIEVSAATTAPVTVTYRINDASWSWVYQARLDTNKKKLSLERQGQVQQGSGEDWNDVQLTLTTTQPEDDVSTPTVAAEFLDLQVPKPPQPMARRNFDKSAVGIAMAAAPPVETRIVAESPVVMAATQYLVEYQVPARVSLNADRQVRMYPIADDAFDADIIARVMPGESRRAHLEATFKYERDVPIEAGQLQLYRDGAFVGEAATQAFLPGAEVRMPFGVDERIKVAVRDETAKSNESGVLSKQMTRETRQRFEITSYHASSIPVEVIDRVPVSRNADVKVEILKGATEPTTKDLNGKAGVLLWQFTAQPQQTTAIRHYYSIRYPRDRVLEASYETE